MQVLRPPEKAPRLAAERNIDCDNITMQRGNNNTDQGARPPYQTRPSRGGPGNKGGGPGTDLQLDVPLFSARLPPLTWMAAASFYPFSLAPTNPC